MDCAVEMVDRLSLVSLLMSDTALLQTDAAMSLPQYSEHPTQTVSE